MNPIGLTIPVRQGDSAAGEALVDKRADTAAAADFAGDLARCLQPGCTVSAPISASHGAQAVDRHAQARVHTAPERTRSAAPASTAHEVDADATATFSQPTDRPDTQTGVAGDDVSGQQNTAAMLALIQGVAPPMLAPAVGNVHGSGSDASALQAHHGMGPASSAVGAQPELVFAQGNQLPLDARAGESNGLSSAWTAVAKPAVGPSGQTALHSGAMSSVPTASQDLTTAARSEQLAPDGVPAPGSAFGHPSRQPAVHGAIMASVMGVGDGSAGGAVRAGALAPFAPASTAAVRSATSLPTPGLSGVQALRGATMPGALGVASRAGAVGLSAAGVAQPAAEGTGGEAEAWALPGLQGVLPSISVQWQTLPLPSGIVPMNISWMRSARDDAADQAPALVAGEAVSGWLGDGQSATAMAGISAGNGLVQGAVPEAFARQVAAQVQAWVGASLRSADITLNHQQEDALQVRIELQGQEVSIHFRTDVASTREVMAQHLDRLQGLLQAQGLNLADTSFAGFGGQGRQGQETPFTSTESLARWSESPAMGPAAPLTPSRPSHVGRVGAVDVFV